jgi:hypothetical protein
MGSKCSPFYYQSKSKLPARTFVTDADLPVTWSLTISSWNRYVRILSPLIPEPTCSLRRTDSSCFCTLLKCWLSFSSKFSFASFNEFSRLRVCAVATVPVRRWVIRADDCTLFRFWPPQPVPEYHSILKSRSFQVTAGASCGSITATVTVEV